MDPEAYHGTELDKESVNMLSSDKMSFMNVSVELKTENDHFSKVDNKVKNTKTKQSNGNQDSKRTESSSAQEGQMTDDIGRLVTTKMVALWNSSFALLFIIV